MIYVALLFFILLICDRSFSYYRKYKVSRLSINIKKALETTGFPLILVENNDYIAYFLIDTGAGSNLINSRVINDFKYTPIEGEASIVDVNGNNQEGKFVKFDFKYKDKHVMSDIFQVHEAVGLDRIFCNTDITVIGILGNPFLQKYGCVLDYSDLIIYPNPNKVKK